MSRTTVMTPSGAVSTRGHGEQAMQMIDPSTPVELSQVAMSGINGMNGPYAAALGSALITDKDARDSAQKTIAAISGNLGYGGGHGSGGGSYHGRIKNSHDHPIVVYKGRTPLWTLDPEESKYVPAQGLNPCRLDVYEPGCPAPHSHTSLVFWDHTKQVGTENVIFNAIL